MRKGRGKNESERERERERGERVWGGGRRGEIVTFF